ncbi:unnamed protein product [Discosporangium mesarthrocarpum]
MASRGTPSTGRRAPEGWGDSPKRLARASTSVKLEHGEDDGVDASLSLDSSAGVKTTFRDPAQVKWRIFEAVSTRNGNRAFASYWSTLKGFMEGTVGRCVLDEVVMSSLGEENVALHNDLILCLINNSCCHLISADLKNHTPLHCQRQTQQLLLSKKQVSKTVSHLNRCASNPEAVKVPLRDASERKIHESEPAPASGREISSMAPHGSEQQEKAGVPPPNSSDMVVPLCGDESDEHDEDVEGGGDDALLEEMDELFGCGSSVWNPWADNVGEADDENLRPDMEEGIEATHQWCSKRIPKQGPEEGVGEGLEERNTKERVTLKRELETGSDHELQYKTRRLDRDNNGQRKTEATSLKSREAIEAIEGFYRKVTADDSGPGYLPQRIPGSRTLAPLLQAATANKHMKVTHEVCRVMTASVKEYARRLLEACVKSADEIEATASGLPHKNRCKLTHVAHREAQQQHKDRGLIAAEREQDASLGTSQVPPGPRGTAKGRRLWSMSSGQGTCGDGTNQVLLDFGKAFCDSGAARMPDQERGQGLGMCPQNSKRERWADSGTSEGPSNPFTHTNQTNQTININASNPNLVGVEEPGPDSLLTRPRNVSAGARAGAQGQAMIHTDHFTSGNHEQASQSHSPYCAPGKRLILPEHLQRALESLPHLGGPASGAMMQWKRTAALGRHIPRGAPLLMGHTNYSEYSKLSCGL